jgi:signal transduction histidine kinase
MLRFGLIHLRYRRSTFLAYAIVSVFSLPSRLLDASSTMTFVLFTLGVGIVVTALVLPLLFVACNIMSRYRLGDKSIAYPILVIASVGAIRGLILQGVLVVLDLEDGLSTASGLLSSTIFTLIYFVGISSFMEILIQKKESFNQIFNQSAALLTHPSSDLIGHSSEQTYVNTVAAVKASVNEHLSSKMENGLIDAKSASLEIQRQINEVLRPLSHRLWVNSLGQIKHTNLISILKDAISDIEFSPTVLLAYQVIVGGFGIALVLGVRTSIYLSIVAALTSFAVIFLFYKFKPRVTEHPFAFGVTFLFSIGLFPVLVPIAIRTEIFESPYLFLGLIISPTLPGFIVLASTYKLISRDRDIAVSAAASVSWQLANSAYLSKSDTAKEEELAEYFHNSLQSELFGIAKKLEHLDVDEEQVETKSLLKSLDLALDRGYHDTVPRESDGVARITSLIDSWKGICNVTVTGIETLDPNSDLAFKVSKLIGEMITNSIRYGKATEIEFQLTSQADSFEISLTHDGEPQVNQKSGLGTLLITRHAREGVITQVDDGKTYYKISLP